MALYTLKLDITDDQVTLTATPTPTLTPTPTITITPSLTLTPSTTISPTEIISSPTPTSTPSATINPTSTTTPTSTPTPTPTPTPTQNPIQSSSCQSMNNGLPNSEQTWPNSSTSLPQTTKEVCAFNRTSYYSLPYRNPNCRATQQGIRQAYERIKTFYPTYWQNSKLLSDWETVQFYSIKYNLNPLFVISLWLEESAAGGAYAQQLGCLYRFNKNGTWTYLDKNSSICDQMECLFAYPQIDPNNFARWACSYRFGSGHWENNHCKEAIRFTRTVEFWYTFISQYDPNFPTNCRIQFFSNADSECQID